MSIIESIKQRESVRTYDGKGLNREEIDAIENFIGQIKAPFGINARIKLIRTDIGEGKEIKLGTYGFISGAKDYLALIYEDAPLAEEGAAYLFEQVVLLCTSLDLGTCWLGGSFSRKNFKDQVEMKPGENMKIVSPVGHRGDKIRFIESLMGFDKKKPRKPFEEIFFNGDFSTPLTEAEAGIYREPLEMVRLGPSANNKQSWRVVKDGEILHFYATSSYGFSAIDMGIALCHFEQTCRELGIKGRYDVSEAPEERSAKYTISWIFE